MLTAKERLLREFLSLIIYLHCSLTILLRLNRCEFGDPVFRKCVPSCNRNQVLHQATVSGLTWGVFITAKVEDGHGSIIQTVFIKTTNEQQSLYLKRLLRLAGPLCGWLYDTEKMERGYLVEEDRPDWLSDKQWKVLKSRFKIWSALHRKVNSDGPFLPLGALKHASQWDYNKAKWGLDKCTENSLKIALSDVSLSLEAKYVIRMFDGVVANAWKFEQGYEIIRRYVQKRRLDGKPKATCVQIRNQAKTFPLKDFVYNVSIDWLKALEVERIVIAYSSDLRRYGFRPVPRAQNSANRRGITTEEEQVVATINTWEQKLCWPVKKNTVKVFHENEDLTRLRMFVRGNTLQHRKTQTQPG